MPALTCKKMPHGASRREISAIAVIEGMENKFSDENDYDDEDAAEQEWIPLGSGIWLIRFTLPDGGTAVVQWAKQRPGGGFEVDMTL